MGAEAHKSPDYTPINRRIIDIKNHFKDILPPDEYNTAGFDDVDEAVWGIVQRGDPV